MKSTFLTSTLKTKRNSQSSADWLDHIWEGKKTSENYKFFLKQRFFLATDLVARLD